ncbi:MAG: flagellar protein FlbB [Methyloligellaceae bacterium]
MGNVRLLPLLVFAGLCLLVLKAMGLLVSGGYVLSGTAPASAQNTQAGTAAAKPQSTQAETAAAKPQSTQATASQENSGDKQAVAPQKQESRPAAKQEAANEQAKPETSKAADNAPPEAQIATVGPAAGGTTKAELAVLQGLVSRRKVLDQRERELGLRENLLKAAEQRVEARINELKAIESRIETNFKKHDDNRNAQYQRLVTMYSGMKPKDAARIFDRLELNVLVDLVSRMKPRIMSAILAAMAPAAVERLTLEIANRSKLKPRASASLPKIQSKKTN